MTTNSIGFAGQLKAKKIAAQKADLSWRLRNTFRARYIWGFLCNKAAVAFSAVTKVPTMTAELQARKIYADGRIVDYGTLDYRVVTDAGVAFLVDDWDDDTTDITTMNYHAAGTDNTAEAAGQTGLIAEATTVTDRVAGTKSQPAAHQLQSVATLSFTGTASIVEHGLLSSGTEGAGTLWDRSVFTGIGVENGDSIQFTYVCSINSGS